jgi:hypothetical protein
MTQVIVLSEASLGGFVFYEVAFDSKEQRVRENAGEAATDIFLEVRFPFWPV